MGNCFYLINICYDFYTVVMMICLILVTNWRCSTKFFNKHKKVRQEISIYACEQQTKWPIFYFDQVAVDVPCFVSVCVCMCVMGCVPAMLVGKMAAQCRMWVCDCCDNWQFKCFFYYNCVIIMCLSSLTTVILTTLDHWQQVNTII